MTANPASLTFATSNWDTAQTVTVLAAEDADALEDTATVTHTVAGGDYQSFAASSVSVTVQDNDMPGVAVSPSSLTIDEGATGTYTVELNTQPSGNVTVAITIEQHGRDPVLDRLHAAGDQPDVLDIELEYCADGHGHSGSRTAMLTNDMATLTHNPSGGGYGSVSNASLTVTVTDPDTAGVTVFPETPLTITEGSTGNYSVRLDTQPLGTVTVTPESDNADVRVTPASLRFTTVNWATPQVVTVTARDDGDATDDTATVTHDGERLRGHHHCG